MDPEDYTQPYTCFYVNNTTDGLNKLASALITGEDDLVLCTRIEHHANDLPWRERCRVIYAEVDEQGRVDPAVKAMPLLPRLGIPQKFRHF